MCNDNEVVRRGLIELELYKLQTEADNLADDIGWCLADNMTIQFENFSRLQWECETLGIIVILLSELKKIDIGHMPVFSDFSHAERLVYADPMFDCKREDETVFLFCHLASEASALQAMQNEIYNRICFLKNAVNLLCFSPDDMLTSF